MSHSQGRAVSSLATLYIVRMLGLFMVLPVLKIAGDEYSGSTEFLLAVALGIYGLTQAVLQIPFGVLSDRWGRKPLIAIGLTLFALGSVVCAYAESAYGLIFGRALQGAGAIAGVVMAMVADLTSEQHRSKAMASIGVSIGVAFAASLVLGPIVTNFGGIRAIFWLSLFLAIIGFFVLFFWVPVSSSQAKRPLLSGISIVLNDRSLWHINMSVFLLHALLMLLFVLIPPLLKNQLSVDSQAQAWFYLKVVMVAFVIMIPMIIVAERKHRMKTMMATAIGLMLIAFVLLVYASSYLVVTLAMLLFFIGFNFFEASLPSLMTKVVSPLHKGAGSGVFSTCQFLGAAAGAVGGGYLETTLGFTATLGVAITILVIWLISLLALNVPKPQAKI